MNPTAEKIKARFPEMVLVFKEWRGDLALTIPRGDVVPVCTYLHENPEMDFDYIVHISSVDFPEASERFEMVYEFYSIQRRERR